MENENSLGKNEENLIPSSIDGSPAINELSAMKHGLTVLRSEFQELQSKCADLLLANSAPSDSISDVFAETPPTDFMTTYIRERIEDLISEKISSTQPSVLPENQHHYNKI